MDVFSFTTIILLLIIIVGTYLIFTNQIEGKLKIIIIIVVLLCLIYFIINLIIIKTTSPVDASIITNVPEIDTTTPLIDTTSPTFSLTTWIYITDWKPGVTKTIFSMTNEYTPKINLDSNINELVITYYTQSSISDDFNLETIIIPQIRIQKWINIVINFGDNSVDSYLDGKLVDTRISTGSKQYVTTIPNNTRLNWGGFTGYISSYKYKPKVLSPQNVLKMYNKGR